MHMHMHTDTTTILRFPSRNIVGKPNLSRDLSPRSQPHDPFAWMKEWTHPLHQLYELKPFLGVDVEDGKGGASGTPTVSMFTEGSAEGSPAQAAGIEIGDKLVSVGGVPITSGRQLEQRMSQLSAGLDT